jgi:hypothetical protein
MDCSAPFTGDILRNFQPQEMAAIKKVLSKFDARSGRHNEVNCHSGSHQRSVHRHLEPPAADEVVRLRCHRKKPIQHHHHQLMPPAHRHRRECVGHRRTVTSPNSTADGLETSPLEQNDFPKSLQVRFRCRVAANKTYSTQDCLYSSRETPGELREDCMTTKNMAHIILAVAIESGTGNVHLEYLRRCLNDILFFLYCSMAFVFCTTAVLRIRCERRQLRQSTLSGITADRMSIRPTTNTDAATRAVHCQLEAQGTVGPSGAAAAAAVVDRRPSRRQQYERKLADVGRQREPIRRGSGERRVRDHGLPG